MILSWKIWCNQFWLLFTIKNIFKVKLNIKLLNVTIWSKIHKTGIESTCWMVQLDLWQELTRVIDWSWYYHGRNSVPDFGLFSVKCSPHKARLRVYYLATIYILYEYIQVVRSRASGHCCRHFRPSSLLCQIGGMWSWPGMYPSYT